MPRLIYEVTYLTPQIKLSAFACSAAWFVVAGYSMVTFTLEIKKKRRELALVEAAKESPISTSEPIKEKESEAVPPSQS